MQAYLTVLHRCCGFVFFFLNEGKTPRSPCLTSKKYNSLYLVLALWRWARPEPAVFPRSACIRQILRHFISGENLQVLYKISLGLSGRFVSFYVLV